MAFGTSSPQTDILSIFSQKDIELSQDSLGKGSYGIVYSGLLRAKGKEKRRVAIKRNIASKSTQGLETLREMDVLSRMERSPFVIPLLGFLITEPSSRSFFPKDYRANHFEESKHKDDWLHFVLPLESTNLSKAIHRDKFSYSSAKIIALQILLGLRSIHSQSIIHRDLKPANILLSIDDSTKLPVIKLCDFGMCGLDNGLLLDSPGLVTASHRAPEICWGDDYSYPIDVFSVGLILFEMVSRRKLMSISNKVSAKEEHETILKTLISAIPELTSEIELKELRSCKDSIPVFGKFSLETRKILSARSNFIQTPEERIISVSQRIRTLFNFSEAEIDRFNSAVPQEARFLELCDLIARLLTFQPENRITVGDALTHPFFDGWANKLYDLNPVSTSIFSRITINFDNPQRQLANAFLIEIWNRRKKNRWYEHQILFHAMDILDRYFAVSITTPPSEDEPNLIYLKCYAALYIFHKYFSTISPIVSWRKFVGNQDFASANALARALEFEQELVVLICNFKIYRETLFEIFTRRDGRVSENRVRECLVALSGGEGIRVIENYEELLLREERVVVGSPKKVSVVETPEKIHSVRSTHSVRSEEWEDVSSERTE